MKQRNKIVLIILIINLVLIINMGNLWGKTILDGLAGNGGDSDDKTFHFDSGNVNFQMKKQDYTTTITNAEINSVYCTPDGMTIYNDGIEYIKTYGFNAFGADLSGGNWTNNAYPTGKNVAVDPNIGRFKFSQDYCWLNARILETGNHFQTPNIAFYSNGTGMCVYLYWDGSLWRVYAKKYNGTNWESAVCIDANNGYESFEPIVDFDGSGNAIAIFRQHTGSFSRIYFNKHNGTSWGTAQCIDEGDFDHSMDEGSDLDCESSGKAVAVFTGKHSGVWRIYANVYDGTNWGTAECIDNANKNQSCKVAMDGNGNAICVFNEFDNWKIYANRYNGTNWEGPVEINATGSETDSALRPRIVFDNLGNAICVFSQLRKQFFTWYDRVYATRYNGTSWEVPVLIDSVPGNTNTVQNWSRAHIDFNTNNNAFATFYQWNGSNYRIYANKYIAGTGWGTAELIDAGAQDALDIYHNIAYDGGNGTAIAAFAQSDGTHERIYANVYDGSNWGTAELIDFTSSFDATDIPCIKFTNINNNAICVFSQKFDASWSRIYYSKYEQAFPIGTIHVDYNNDSPPPGEWSNFASQKLDLSWINESETNDDITPDCRIQVRDTILGLDVSSAQYNYSIDGGNTWQFPLDDFDNASLGSNWTAVDHNTTGGSAVENGTELTINGGGEDVWNANDEFYIVYDTLEGDFAVEVKINYQEDTEQFAKAGIMVRNAIVTQANNGYCAVAVLPQRGWQFLWDNDNNGYLDTSSSAGTTAYPCYLKLIKTGTNFKSYYSLNGLNWTILANVSLSNVNTTQIVGMFVCSRLGTTVGSVKFDHFKGWKLTSCSGTGGSTSFETITSFSVPFNQSSDNLNKIKFNIADTDGTIGFSPLYTVKTGMALSISVDSSSYDFGTVIKKSTTTATSSITVTNDGSVNERYSLHLTAPAGWTCTTDTAPEVEEFRMCGNFQTATAQTSHFDIGGSFSDAIGTTQRVCSTGDFGKDDEGEAAKGYNVPPSEDRYLWFRFESPTSTSLTTQQTITVTITAEEQP